MALAVADLDDDLAPEPGEADDRPAGAPRWARLLLLLAVVGFVGSGLVQAWRDAPTVDEGVDLATGLSGWVNHDLRMCPEHPSLPKLAAALPALLAHPIVPKGDAWDRGAWFDYEDDLIRANDQAGRLHAMVFLGRLVPLAEAVACGWLIFLLARRLVGERGALLSAGLWFTTPFVVGLGHIQSLDMAFTLATLAVALALLRFREEPGVGRALTVGVAVGLAVATRHTGIVLVPVTTLVVGATLWPDRERLVRSTGAMLLSAYGALWAAYRGFDPTPPSGAAGANLHGIIGQASSQSLVAKLVLAVPAPLEWRAGFGYLMLTSGRRPAWLFGQAWMGSRFWFFPGSLLAKVPLGALLVLVLGPLFWRHRPGPARRNAAVAVALPALGLLLLVMAQPLNLGLRLVLPSVALLCVAAAPAADLLRRRWGQIAIGLVLATQVLAMVAAGFHSIAWSPPPFSPAYRYVSDSNVDFGQDLYELRAWSRGRSPWVAIGTPRGIDIPDGSRALVGADPASVRGWVAVSVTELTVSHRDELAWLRKYCPIDTLGGGGVLLFRFDAPPSPTPGPTTPAALCRSSSVSHPT